MKSQVDAGELMERIRLEALRQRDALYPAPATPAIAAPAVPLVPPPTYTAGPPEGSTSESLLAHALLTHTAGMVERARRKTTVGGGVPKWLRPFYRNQGGYNAIVLDTLDRLLEANRRLVDDNAQLREQVARQAVWMQASAQGFESLNNRLASLERQNDHDQNWLQNLQAHAEAQTAHAAESHRLINEAKERSRGYVDEQAGMFRAHVDALQAQADFHRVYTREVRDRLDDLGGHVNILGEHIEQVSRRTDETRAHVERVNHQADEIRTHVERVNQQTDEIRTHVERVNQQTDGVRGHVERVNHQADEVQGHADRLATHLRNLQTQADEQGAHTHKVHGHLDELGKHVNVLSGHIEQVGRGTDEVRGHVERVGRQTDEVRGHVERVAHQTDEVRGQLEHLRARTDETRAHVERVNHQADAVQNHADRLAAHLRNLQAQTDDQGTHSRQVHGHLDELGRHFDRTLEDEHLETRVGDLAGRVDRLDDRQHTDAAFLKTQLWLLQRAASGIVPTPSGEHVPPVTLPDALAVPASDLDALYVAFENVFRGSRQDIKERLEIYLPPLREAHVGAANRPVLDLGCGRGEWLELLKEQGFAASGIDLNGCMILECRERGLDAAHANAVEHLISLPPETVGAITAFHLIEHLPFDVLVRFFRECRRVLQPGGIAIFETPNPYNLIVGAAQFYDDHTHQRPLPPNSTRFLVEQAGFARADILPLHPRDPADKVHGDGTNETLVARFNELFYGPQDYAIIAATS